MSRVTDLIAASGKSVEEVGLTAGIARERLSAIMGGVAPTMAELRAIGRAIGCKLSAFTRDVEPEKARLEFRAVVKRTSQESAPASAVDLLSARIAHVLELMPHSRKASLAWLDLFQGSHLSAEDAERDAQTFRSAFFGDDQMGPLMALPEILADVLDVLLFVCPELQIDGASAIKEDVAFVFLAPRSFTPRMLFTMAHEVGHLVAHHERGETSMFIDVSADLGAGQTTANKREQFAHRFASTLLLPAQSVGLSLQRFRTSFNYASGPVGDIEVLFLARLFGVSFGVAAQRCEDLDLLERGGARSLHEKLNKSHGSPEKRADEIGLPPRADFTIPRLPSSLLRAAISQIREGEASVGRVAGLLQMQIRDIMAANALPS